MPPPNTTNDGIEGTDIPCILTETVEQMDDEIAVVDSDGTIIYVNDAWKTFSDTNGGENCPDDVLGVGANYLDVCESAKRDGDKFGESVHDGLTDVLEGERSRFGYEYPCHTESGSEWFQVFIRAVTLNGEQYAYLMHVDITERVLVEREAKQKMERLETMASILTHDLRNPLQAAAGYNEILLSKLDDFDGTDEEVEELRESAHRVERSLQRMEQIINDGVRLSKDKFSEVSSLNLSEHRSGLEFGNVAWDAWENVVTGRATLNLRDSFMLYGDEGLVLLVLENLFRNALVHGKGMDDTRSITVEVGAIDSDRGRAGWYLEDDGVGIPSEVRESVVEKGVTHGVTGGSGTGLATVRQIADAHGWEMTITESASGGARFEFYEDLTPD